MSEGSTDPTPETMAREAGYIEGSAMERAFCTGVDTERLRQEAKRRAAVLAEREACAEIAETYPHALEPQHVTADRIAAAILARSKP